MLLHWERPGVVQEPEVAAARPDEAEHVQHGRRGCLPPVDRASTPRRQQLHDEQCGQQPASAAGLEASERFAAALFEQHGDEEPRQHEEHGDAGAPTGRRQVKMHGDDQGDGDIA